MKVRCSLCNSADLPVSEGVGVCSRCLQIRTEQAVAVAASRHLQHREADRLPPTPPRDPGGKACGLCVQQCVIGKGHVGFCGLRRNVTGRLQRGTRAGNFSWYHDPLPTNCVADWVCPGGTGAGYPALAHRPGPERGYANLAVFSQVCSFDCAFCQNGEYRRLALQPASRRPEALADAVDKRTACVCFFGGDPSPQMPLFLRAASLARERNEGQILRICWETNGSLSRNLLDAALDLCLESGGCIKFDLKAFTPGLHRALTGAENARTLENFVRAAARTAERPEPPLVIASTLLIPGYVEIEEVAKIAAFVAAQDPHIPYSLLAFHPSLYMRDLPLVTASQAAACREAALSTGLTRVRVGNARLLAPG